MTKIERKLRDGGGLLVIVLAMDLRGARNYSMTAVHYGK